MYLCTDVQLASALHHTQLALVHATELQEHAMALQASMSDVSCDNGACLGIDVQLTSALQQMQLALDAGIATAGLQEQV